MDIRKEIDEWFEDDTFINRYLWELHDTLNGVRKTENQIDELINELEGEERLNLLLLSDSNQNLKLKTLKDLYQLYKDNMQ